MQSPRSMLTRRRRRPRSIASVFLSTAMMAATFAGNFAGPGAGVARATHTPPPLGLNLILSDLEFVLQQIKIAEAHAAGGELFGPGPTQISSPLLPNGLRTVNGEFNNIIPGQEDFGAADRQFPRAGGPATFRDGETFDPDGPGPAPASPTSYAQTSGVVVDSQPRVISNLIVDQTTNNPAAVAAAAQNPNATQGPNPRPGPGRGDLFFIPNAAPDVGLSAPFNAWFTFFGQFFDHGLDLVAKGGSGVVFAPLQEDDPLFVPGGNTNFMVLTRATNQPGPDGMLGTADDIHEATNTTTPFVDQNQTYTAHPSHQVFLRQYELNGIGRPVSDGKMLEGAGGGLSNWAEVKAQAAAKLGLRLSDQDVLNVPLLATDQYGMFKRGPNGYPQVVTAAPAGLVEGNPAGGGVAIPANAVRTGSHAFMDDIAHHAVPFGDHDGNPATPRQALTPDSDPGTTDDNNPATYDDELLNAHFITGDGRGNENIALTSVHHVFHAEHNRLVGQVKDVILTGTPAFVAEWQLSPGVWNGERIFQAARFFTEMQYQHLVFEEFARKVQPQVNVFTGFHDEIDPAIVAEFAHAVYRFGHSMLRETVARTNADGTTSDIGLIEAFLNPLAFTAPGGGSDHAAGAVVRGTTRQVGNEIDEFVTEALRNNLLGLPLDLPTINLLRGRDTGVPTLNAARRQFYAATSDAILQPYDSWTDFMFSLRHEESLVNFVAAYGKHPSVMNATTTADKRAAAAALVLGPGATPEAEADRIDFLNSTGIYANTPEGLTVTGVDDIDLWVGGLAEKQMPFGGLLGSTFNFVFETQMEKLQDGDRLYYLARTAGLNFLTELEDNSFAELISRNTDTKHLPLDVFSRPDFIFELGSNGDDPATPGFDESTLLTRAADGTYRFAGPEHVLWGGTEGADRIRSSEGDDSLYGDGGNDRIEGGAGNDLFDAGAGDDILTDSFGDDNLKGGGGHDAINAGQGFDLVLGGSGNDFVVAGDDPKETFGGAGDDFIFAGNAEDIVFANEGSDWIEGGNQADLLQGDNGAPFQDDASPGHDVIIGGGGNDDYDSEGGDDIMVTGPGIERNEGMLGFDWVTAKDDPQAANFDLFFTGLQPPDLDNIRDRFDIVEALSGWKFNDVLRGDNADAASMVGHELTNVGLIGGLAGVLPAGATTFTGGNIILGGAGSDIMEGRAGNDILDGDKWLDVSISVRNATDPNLEVRRARTMAGVQADIFAGRINPGQLRTVREILTTTPGSATDTAVFSGPLADYDVTNNGDGTTTVVHARGTLADGTDTLRNIERMQFADQTVTAPGANQPATGTVTISDTTPAKGQALTATPAYSDPQGIQPGSEVFTWQSEQDVDAWVPVAQGRGFTPRAAEVGFRLRVVATFRDGAGVPESVTSAPTEPVTGAADTTPPTAPTAVTAEGISQSAIRLSWVAATDNVGVAEYRIFRDANPTPVGTTTSTLFTDTGLAPGSTHIYTVAAVDAGGNVTHSAPVSSTTQSAPVPGVTVTPTSVGFGNRFLGTTSPPSTVTISNSGPPGSVLTISGVAVNGIDFTAASNTCAPLPRTLAPGASCSVGVTFSPQTVGSRSGTLVFSHDAPGGSTTVPLSGAGVGPPPVPTGVTATAISSSQITVSWNASTGAARYLVFRNGGATPVAVTPGTTTFTDSGLAPDTVFTYRVVAEDTAFGQSAMSAAASARTLPVLSASPNPVQFGSQSFLMGTVTRTVTVRNNAITTQTVSTLPITGPNAGEFTVITNQCTGQPLAPGATCTFQVRFNPSGTGLRTATVTVNRASGGTGFPVALRGTGTLL